MVSMSPLYRVGPCKKFETSTFYGTFGVDFARTRQKPWPGWKRCVNIQGRTLTKVLDLGCGNGRFYDFIKEKNIQYTGLDNSKVLLNLAKQRFASPKAQFVYQDVFDLNKLPKGYDLVVAFGLTHHVPNHGFRLKWFNKIRTLLNPNAILILTFWHYHLDKRFEKKAVKIEGGKNDYMLSWNNYKSQRLYHLYTKDELSKIKSQYRNNDVELVDEFESDGRTNNLNKYLVFRKIKK